MRNQTPFHGQAIIICETCEIIIPCSTAHSPVENRSKGLSALERKQIFQVSQVQKRFCLKGIMEADPYKN